MANNAYRRNKIIATPQKKSWRYQIIELLENMQTQINDMKKDMQKDVDKAVDGALAERIVRIDAALTETIIHKEILIDKGYFTRDEANAKLEELRAKANK